jgi:hypothetical protein
MHRQLKELDPQDAPGNDNGLLPGQIKGGKAFQPKLVAREGDLSSVTQPIAALFVIPLPRTVNARLDWTWNLGRRTGKQKKTTKKGKSP